MIATSVPESRDALDKSAWRGFFSAVKDTLDFGVRKRVAHGRFWMIDRFWALKQEASSKFKGGSCELRDAGSGFFLSKTGMEEMSKYEGSSRMNGILSKTNGRKVS